jgi:hypothetical protein
LVLNEIKGRCQIFKPHPILTFLQFVISKKEGSRKPPKFTAVSTLPVASAIADSNRLLQWWLNRHDNLILSPFQLIASSVEISPQGSKTTKKHTIAARSDLGFLSISPKSTCQPLSLAPRSDIPQAHISNISHANNCSGFLPVRLRPSRNT